MRLGIVDEVDCPTVLMTGQSNKQTLNQNAKRYTLLPVEYCFLDVFFTVRLGIVHDADCFTVLMTGQLLVACQSLCMTCPARTSSS